MAHTYTTTLSMGIGGDEPTWEGEATVRYTVAWGRPATGPTYSHGGLPADPDEITHLVVTHIDGKNPRRLCQGMTESDALEDKIWGSESLLEALLNDAAEQRDADLEAAMERRWEERAEWGMQ